MAETRPDVLFARVSSRGTSMSAPVLEGYRERLCRHGFGPYKGLNVPSSGWVAANLMLQVCGIPLCVCAATASARTRASTCLRPAGWPPTSCCRCVGGGSR
jgi:hypothetical protein